MPEPLNREIDIERPSPARAYDYLLGGTDNYPADRASAEGIIKAWPGMRDMGRAIRAWMIRAVTYAAGENVSQFLDIGSGLPTAENVHQVAQRINPDAKVVYIDNDPIVLAHGRALLAENDRTIYFDADVRNPERILQGASRLLDFDQPIAVILSAVLHWVPEEEDVVGLMAEYVRALAAGSLLAISCNTLSNSDPDIVAKVSTIFPGGWYPRDPDEIQAFFQGLPMVAPGLTWIEQWRATAANPEPLPSPLLGGIAIVT